MRDWQKFRVKATGKMVKAKAIGDLRFKDKSGMVYDLSDLEYIKRNHVAASTIRIGSVSITAFARDFWKYRSFVLGINVDVIGDIKACDIELKIACFGIGLRFQRRNK